MNDRSKAPHVYFGLTVSICPRCHAPLPASLLERDGKVYMSKTCPTHGRFTTLLASDAEWYHAAQRDTSPTVPLERFQTKVSRGCPLDCGVCPEHQQNNAAPVIEITNVCNIDCPVCFADNRHDYVLGDEDMERCLDVIARSGTSVDVLILTGGEPTAHPRLLELIDRALARPFVPRVAIATNGIQLGKSPSLASGLAERRVDVILQLDSMDAAKNRVLRGRDMLGLRESALANLDKYGVRTTILMTVVKGLNDDELGALVKFALERPFIAGFEAQTMSYTGRGGRQVDNDPLDRITGTDLIRGVVDQTGGLLQRSDFVPMPHPHPNCVAVTYLPGLADGSFVPFTRFARRDLFKDSIANHFIAAPNERHETMLRQIIDDAWVDPSANARAPLILTTLRRLLLELFPADHAIDAAARTRILERHIKHVFLHTMMDDDSFDAAVLRKCTSMMVLPDGRMIPHCGYRVIHRQSDPRYAVRPPASVVHGIDGLRGSLHSR